jgi:AAA+ superfamily predicted ATPase
MSTEYNDLFEGAITYPDIEYQERYNELIGIDDYKSRVVKLLSVFINPNDLINWAEKHYKKIPSIVNSVLKRPPLIVFEGDVGSGKTELAITIGDEVARLEKIDITLFPLSLSTRGEGRVGQMTKQISEAFEVVVSKAQKLKNGTKKSLGGVILLIDEADSLAQSRESEQMHHEDRAGVNALIRGIDRLGNGKLPGAVIMCTNRINALDPAIRRRAADIITFGRPNDEQRRELLNKPLSELGLKEKEISQIADATGKNGIYDYGFTFSDLTQRFLPTIILDAYPKKKVLSGRVLELVKHIKPTPPFKEEINDCT